MVRSRRGGSSGGAGATDRQTDRAEARQAACEPGRRAASLRSGLPLLSLDAGNSEQFSPLPAAAVTRPVLTSRRFDAKKKEEKKKTEEEKKKKGRSCTRVGLWI